MVEIAHIDVMLSGDVGGAGISRFWFQRQDATPPTVSDCNAAAAAVRALWGAASTYLAADMTYTISPEVELVAHDTGAVSGLVTLSSVPSPVTGGGGGNYAAGTGYRLNWRTLSVHNRRFIRGCNFFTPVASGGWNTAGGPASGAISGMASAITTYLAALNTAVLEPIIWHRPLKGTFTGGAVGLVVAGAVSATPASLRTRRTLCCGVRYSAESARGFPPCSPGRPIRYRWRLWISEGALSTAVFTPRERSWNYSDVLLHSGILGKGRRPGGIACGTERGFGPGIAYTSGTTRGRGGPPCTLSRQYDNARGIERPANRWAPFRLAGLFLYGVNTHQKEERLWSKSRTST